MARGKRRKDKRRSTRLQKQAKDFRSAATQPSQPSNHRRYDNPESKQTTLEDRPNSPELSAHKRGQERRAADAHEDEPNDKATKKSPTDDVSTRRRVLRTITGTSRALRNLNLEAGDIIQVREVSHQLDNSPAPEFQPDRAEKMTYFTINGERFCSKWRIQIITKTMPDGFRCVSIYTHNGQGLRMKTAAQKRAYVSVRDTRQFPLNTSTIFHVEGNNPAPLTDEMYGSWELKEKSTARLEYKEFDNSKLGFKVGKLTEGSPGHLQKLLDRYPGP